MTSLRCCVSKAKVNKEGELFVRIASEEGAKGGRESKAARRVLKRLTSDKARNVKFREGEQILQNLLQ